MKHIFGRSAHAAAGAWLAAALLAGGTAHAASVIDTRPFADSAISPFGERDTTSYGQTFRTPNAQDTRLDSFSFVLERVLGVSRFRAYVYAWDEGSNSLVGDALFAGPARSLQPGPARRLVTTNTQGVTLEAGRDYVAFFSTAGLLDGTVDLAYWAISFRSVYQGGHFVYHNSSGQFPGSDTSWECGAGCDFYDAGFRMGFNTGPAPVPEPASAALMLAGLAVAGAEARRRRGAGPARQDRPRG